MKSVNEIIIRRAIKEVYKTTILFLSSYLKVVICSHSHQKQLNIHPNKTNIKLGLIMKIKIILSHNFKRKLLFWKNYIYHLKYNK